MRLAHAVRGLDSRINRRTRTNRQLCPDFPVQNGDASSPGECGPPGPRPGPRRRGRGDAPACSPAVPAAAHIHSTAVAPTRGRRAAHHTPDGWRSTGRHSSRRPPAGQRAAGLQLVHLRVQQLGLHQEFADLGLQPTVVVGLGRAALQAAWPAAKNLSRHCEARAAVILNSRDTDSRSSPRSKYRHAAGLKTAPSSHARRPLRSPSGLPPSPPNPDRASSSRHSSCENSLAIKCQENPRAQENIVIASHTKNAHSLQPAPRPTLCGSVGSRPRPRDTRRPETIPTRRSAVSTRGTPKPARQGPRPPPAVLDVCGPVRTRPPARSAPPPARRARQARNPPNQPARTGRRYWPPRRSNRRSKNNALNHAHHDQDEGEPPLRTHAPDPALQPSDRRVCVRVLRLFHPAARVAEAEAFLARRIAVVHLLANDVEPAQRPNERPHAFSASVRDVGFRTRR